MPKHLRSQMALACGADVVLELPVCYATGSAEYFATGAVSLLEALGCVDYLCFGSECGEIKILQQIADVLCKEPELYKVLLQKHLKNGNAFPAARKLAFIEYLGKNKSLSWIPEQISAILDSPNNILAIEYLKALSCLNSSIEPVTITREGAGYHDQTLGGLFSSASALRDYRIVNLQKMRITLLLLIIYFRNCHKTVTRFLKKTITNAFLCLQMIFPCF